MTTHATICAYLNASADHHARLSSRDVTLDHFTFRPVWLDADGVLVMAHPTNDLAGPIAAPADGTYHTDDDDEAKARRAYTTAQNDDATEQAREIARHASEQARIATLTAGSKIRVIKGRLAGVTGTVRDADGGARIGFVDADGVGWEIDARAVELDRQ